MFGIGPTELIIIAVIIMILFGAGKLPSVLGDFGKSLRIFKKEIKGLEDDPTDE